MPLIGLALGAPLATAVGRIADYLAAAVLITVGLWMLLDDEGPVRCCVIAAGSPRSLVGSASASVNWPSTLPLAWRTSRSL